MVESSQETNRVFHTKESVRQSLISLLEEKDINHIKAIDVYSKARVSKATFYRYYRDVFDLLVECFELYLDVQGEVKTSIAEGTYGQNTLDLMLLGIRRIQRYPKLYLTCIQCTYAPFISDFSARSTSLSTNSARQLIIERGLTPETCVIPISRLAELCIALTTDINVTWAKSGCIEPAESVAELQNTCVARFIDGMRTAQPPN